MIQRAASLMLLALAANLAWAEDDPADLLRKAAKAADARDSKTAVSLLTRAIAADPKLARAYYLRGRERFRLGDPRGSMADLDRLVALRPDLATRQWERGISCFYAGAFDEGARQFAEYQKYHANDVENAVWRYLCMARTVGAAEARAALLPIEADRRVPMMAIYRMYRGQATADDVLAAARAGGPGADQLRGRLFYAHLYIGLFHEAAGDLARADRHMTQAVKKFPSTHYMGDVARVHLAQRASEKAEIDRVLARWNGAKWADREAASRDLAALVLAAVGERSWGSDMPPRIARALARVAKAGGAEAQTRAAAFTRSWNKLVDDKVLAAALARTAGRTRLVLNRYPRISNDGLAVVSRACPGLRWLALGGEGMSDPGLAHLVRLKRLEILHLSHAGGYRTTPSFSGKGMRHLSGIASLRELWLFDVHVTDAGLARIAELTQLTRLWLSDTGPYVSREAGPRLGPGKVTYKGSSQITDAGILHLGALTGLRELRIRQQPLTTSTCLTILDRMPRLHTLSLYNWDKLTPAGLARIGKVRTLRTLELWSLAEANGAEALAALAGLDKLESLDLGSSDHLGDAAAKLVARQHPALRRLDTSSWDHLTDAGIEALSSLKHLERLRLYFCDRVTDAGLKHLEKVKTLRWIDLTSTKAKWQAVHALKAAIPGLVTANPRRWALVDNPVYQRWKGFAPGTSVTMRYTSYEDDGTTRVTDYTSTLSAIDGHKATLRSTVQRYKGKTALAPRVTTREVLARTPRTPKSSDGQLKKTFKEKIKVGEVSFDCTYRMFQKVHPMRHGRSYTTETRRWSCPGMPGGLVKREWLSDGKMASSYAVTRVTIKR